MHKNAQICVLQFKIFPVAMPPNTHVGEGLRHAARNPTSSALSRSPNVC